MHHLTVFTIFLSLITFLEIYIQSNACAFVGEVILKIFYKKSAIRFYFIAGSIYGVLQRQVSMG